MSLPRYVESRHYTDITFLRRVYVGFVLMDLTMSHFLSTRKILRHLAHEAASLLRAVLTSQTDQTRSPVTYFVSL